MAGAAGVTGAATACAATGMLVAAGTPERVDSAGIVIAAGRRTRADRCAEAIPNVGADLAAAAGPTFRRAFEWDGWTDGPESRLAPVGATVAERLAARLPRRLGATGDGSARPTESAVVWESVALAGAAQADPAP